MATEKNENVEESDLEKMSEVSLEMEEMATESLQGPSQEPEKEPKDHVDSTRVDHEKTRKAHLSAAILGTVLFCLLMVVCMGDLVMFHSWLPFFLLPVAGALCLVLWTVIPTPNDPSSHVTLP